MCKRILNWDYDSKRNIIFIFRFHDYDYQESIKLKNMAVDLDPQGKAVALEIFNSSECLEVEKESLISPEDFLIEISAKNGVLTVVAAFKLTIEMEIIDRMLKEKTVTEYQIKKNIIRPIYLKKEK